MKLTDILAGNLDSRSSAETQVRYCELSLLSCIRYSRKQKATHKCAAVQ